MFDQVSSLDTSRTTWKIKVRVTRMWPSVSSNSEPKDGLKGYNLILLDDDNSHIQAFVYADNWKAFAKDIVQGGLYIISNFFTREAMGTLRPTSSKIIINFSNSTTVEKVNEDDFMIPMHRFEFVDLGDLFRIASQNENVESPELSTDIMGVIEEFENVKPIKTVYGERNIVRFRITDGRYSHKVSVWGQLAVTTDEDYGKIGERPIIAIVTSTKLKTYRSSVQISTLPSSKIFLNLDNDAVNAMRLRLEEEGYKAPEIIIAASPTQTVPVPVIEKIKLTELLEKTNMDDLKKNFLCMVKIETVEETDNWWYLSCLDCKTEVYKLEGKYKCLTCIKNIPVAEKRYKIVVLAGDETEAFNFILSDRAARRIIGQTATKLIADSLKSETTGYPHKIKAIAGKELTFNVEINNDNVLLKSKIFDVTDAYASSVSTPSTCQGTMAGFTVSSFAENMIDLSDSGDTPSSVKSVSKKIKVEK